MPADPDDHRRFDRRPRRSTDDRFLRLRRLEELDELLKDEGLTKAQRDELMPEYAELALQAMAERMAEEDCGELERARLRSAITELSAELEEVYARSARQRVGIRWRGTDAADVELDGWAVAELWHTPAGWTLTPAGDELGLPSEWVAPPGLNGVSADHASRRALSRVADHVARIMPRPGDERVAE